MVHLTRHILHMDVVEAVEDSVEEAVEVVVVLRGVEVEVVLLQGDTHLDTQPLLTMILQLQQQLQLPLALPIAMEEEDTHSLVMECMSQLHPIQGIQSMLHPLIMEDMLKMHHFMPSQVYYLTCPSLLETGLKTQQSKLGIWHQR